MKKLFILLCLLIIFSQSVSAQITTNDTPKYGTTLPATCNIATKSQVLFYKFGASNGLYYCVSTNTWALVASAGGSGTVTSAGLTLPAFLSVTGTPITTAGTFAVTLATQTANTIFAGPSSGGVLAPTFRALVSDDIPSLAASKITSGVFAVARLGTGTPDGTKFLRDDGVFAVPAGGGGGTPGGSNTQVQFNNSSAFGGSANFTWTNATNQLLLTAGAATDVPFKIQLAAAQSGDAFQVYNSAATKLAFIDSSGNFNLGNNLGFKIDGNTVTSYNNGSARIVFGNTGISQTSLNAATDIFYGIGANFSFAMGAANFKAVSGVQIGWVSSATDASTTADTGFTRTSAALIAVTNGVGGAGNLTVADEAYNATNWNSILQVPTKNAVRDQFEAIKVIDVAQTSFYCSDAGANDTYTCSLTPAATGYVTGTTYRFKANTANTGASSINFNSVGAMPIKKIQGSITTDPANNDIRAGQWVECIYDGTNCQMTGQLGNSPSATVTGTDTYVTFFDGTDNPSGDAGFTYNKTTDTVTVGAITTSGSTAGSLSLTEGTTPAAAAANSVQLQVPVDVTTAYDLILPAASSTGLVLGTNAANVNTLSFLTTGSGVTSFLTTPSSANLRTALTDETGTGGAAVFATSPTLTTPNIGVATATHIIGGSGTPSIAAGSGAGTTPSGVSVSGTDIAGEITFTTGTNPPTSATVITITFATAYGSAPKVILTPSNLAASESSAIYGVGLYATSTTTTFLISVSSANSLLASTQYKFFYQVIQ